MAVAAMLAHHYNGEDVRGWYMSRKLNGFRCIWKKGKLWTLGRYSGEQVIHAPEWFLKQLPQNMELDGELWHPSDTLAKVKSICGQGKEKSEADPRWKEIVYCIFNEYNSQYSWIGSHSRLENLLVPSENLSLLNQIQIHYDTPFPKQMEIYSRVLADKYGKIEGLMLVNPNSYYEFKRSKSLLKVKPTYDMEALVLEQTPGEGKHDGRMGAVVVKLTWDDKVASVYGGTDRMINKTVIFSIGGGFSDEEREQTWVGRRIKFSYYGVTENAVPVSANFVEVA